MNHEEREQRRKDRLARNEALFREVNERVKQVAPDDPGEHVGFLCECGDDGCTKTISLSRGEYEHARSEATLFAITPGHEIPEIEHVVERHERFYLVKKHAEEGRIARETDPRA
jgi:hypothetical protein